MASLTVSNIEQKIIFMCEMQGQLSDGYWENATPSDHWKVWCNLKWNDVNIDPNNIGTIGIEPWARRRYNFSSKMLMEVVGYRIRIKVILARMFPEVVLPILEKDHWLIPDCDGDVNDYLNPMHDYYIKKLKTMIEAGLTPDMIKQAIANIEGYSITDLRRDCKGLKLAIKTIIQR